jgi:hypothetical protein
MKQFDDYESSTRVCSCGASITWEGLDDRLPAWMVEHEKHDRSAVEAQTTADGMRAYAEAETTQR